jgi:hypothetical protein
MNITEALKDLIKAKENYDNAQFSNEYVATRLVEAEECFQLELNSFIDKRLSERGLK